MTASSSGSRALGREAVKMVESARRLEALEFSRTTDPTQAKAWLTRIEEVYDLMQCTDELKFRIEVHMLKGRALTWWKFVSGRQLPGVKLTWKNFRREFNQKFYSSLFRDQKMKGFLDLTQENKSVVKYEVAFTELSRYAAPLVRRDTRSFRMA